LANVDALWSQDKGEGKVEVSKDLEEVGGSESDESEADESDSQDSDGDGDTGDSETANGSVSDSEVSEHHCLQIYEVAKTSCWIICYVLNPS
jgi:hypothetical protein